MSLNSKKILVAIGGGIAAFKAVELVRELSHRGASLKVAMTPGSTRFVAPTTFAGLTGHAVASDLFDPSQGGEVHVELADWAELIVVVPATANLMARSAAGMADDVVLATLSCASCPVVYAPAMHERMWLSAANQRNVARLTSDGARMVGPVQGELASGASGWGRMAEPGAIADALADHGAAQDLAGRTLLVSAGPTHEDIDPVRFISNRSSGRMGYAVARAARARGARVILVSGPTSLDTPAGVERVDVRSARDMKQAIDARSDATDAIVMTAAVADYRPATAGDWKLKKDSDSLTIELVKNPDILADLGERRAGPTPVLVGFAMETHDIIEYARGKLASKKIDLVVANDAAVGFGGDTNEATLVAADGETPLPPMAKLELAHRILDRILELLPAGQP